MSIRDVVDRITRYRASLLEGPPTEEDLERELAETSAAAEFGLTGIAPLPESILRLSEVLADPNFETRDAVGALESDPALAVDVLRLANSAAFVGSALCKSTQEAFNRTYSPSHLVPSNRQNRDPTFSNSVDFRRIAAHQPAGCSSSMGWTSTISRRCSA